MPVAGARSQTSCTSITGEVTSPLTVGANQKCTIQQSSGSIAVDTAGTNNTAVNLSAGPAPVNRGTITAKSVPNSPAPFSASERCAAVFAIAVRSFNFPREFLTWASVRLCLHWLFSRLFAGPAARVASLGNRLPRPGHPRPDAPTGRPQTSRFRFLCALALLLGALSSFAPAPAVAQATTPDAPTGLTVTACPICLDLSWTAPSQTLTGYDIHFTRATASNVANNAAVQTDKTAATGWVAVSTSNRPATDTSTSYRLRTAGLRAGSTTRVRVRAKNGSVVGAWAFGSGTPVGQGPPTNLRVTAGNGRLTLSWTAPDGDIRRYELDYTLAPKTGSGAVADDAPYGTDVTAGWISAGFIAADATSYTLTGLTNGRTYRVRLLAFNIFVASVDENDSRAFGTGTPQLPSVLLSVSPNPVTEGSPVTVTATLSQAQSSATVIPLRLTNDSAEDGDYGTLASITIAAGSTTSTGQITTAQDTDADDETFTVALGTLPSGFEQGSPASIEVTIRDDDEPQVSLSVSPNPVAEGSPVTVEATLSHTRSSAAVIPLTLTKVSAEDGDYGTLASITIAAGTTTSTGQITTAQDTDADDETFTVALGALPSGFVEGSPASIEVTIRDDDEPQVSLSVSPNQVTEGSPVTVTATLSHTRSSDAVIPLTLTRGSAEAGDYGTLASITIAANALSGTGQITTAQDTDANNETFTVALGALPSGFVQGSPASIAVTILDDDKAPLAPENLGVRTGIGQLRLTWYQPADTRTAVAAVSGYDVHYTSSASVGRNAAASGTDASSGWVDARHRGTDTTHTITGLVELRAYRVRVRAYNGNVEKSDWVLGSGTPTELPAVSLLVSPNPVTEGSLMTVTATLSETKSSATVIPLTLTKDSAEDGDYGTLASITIAANALSGTGEITAAQDADLDDETFTVALGTLPSGFAQGSPASIAVTILDDDKAPLAPGNLGVGTGIGQLRLTWDQPADTRTEVAAVSGYDVHYTSSASVDQNAAASGTDASSGWVDAGHRGTELEHLISELAGNTLYRVRVRADNGNVEKSDWVLGGGRLTEFPTVSLSVDPNPAVTEGSPVTVTATLSETQSSATVIPLRLTNGSAEDGDYGTLASITIAANVLSGTGEITTAQDTDAEDETFTVALGILPSGFVEGSPASIEVTILDDDKPLAPENLSVRIEMGQLRLTWDQPADTRTAVSGYEVHYTSSASVDQNAAVSGTDASSGWVDAGPRGTELEHLISELAGNTLYRVRVRAYNDKGKSEWLHWQGTTPVAPMVSLSVEPLKVDEGDSVSVTVTLTKGLPADAAIPLDLTNGSAEDGDYGTLASIAVSAGTLSASDTISAQQDADVEDETFTVALGAALPFSAVADASASSAQVTIVDDDGPTDAEKAAVLKQSLEALAGTVLGSAVSTVSERVESSGQPSQPLAGDADGSSSLLRTLSILFDLPQPGNPSASVNDAGHDRWQVHRAHRDEVASPAGHGRGAARYASGQLRLNSFSFSLDEPSAGASGSGGALVLWGRGDSHSFRGSSDDEQSYSGSWNSVYLGIDQGFGAGQLAGVALSVGRGEVNYRNGEGERQSGRYEARLRSVFPYFSAEVADGTRLWATFGYGRGEISNYRAAEEEPGTGDLRLGLAAVGAKHELNEWPAARLSLVGDAGYARLKVDSGVRPLEGLQARVSRVRAGLEVSGRNSAAAAPYLRVSARFERGESARRKGLEAEGGIRWSGARHGAELHARALRLRGNLTTHRETGVGASVYFRPSSDGTGASLTLSHDWGRPRGSDTLWQNGSLSVTDSQSATDLDSARSLNAELGYGLYSERLLGLVTPKLGWREDSAGERRLRIGAAYRANSWLTHQLGVEFGVHRRRTHSGVADYGGDLSASMSW